MDIATSNELKHIRDDVRTIIAREDVTTQEAEKLAHICEEIDEVTDTQ